MKTYVIYSFVSFFISLGTVLAGNYEEAMQQQLELLNQAQSGGEIQQIAFQFERIALAEADQWLPYYWSSYSWVLSCFSAESTDDLDEWLDKAQQLLDHASALNPEECLDEMGVLQAFIHQARIGVNPMVRGMSYSAKAAEALNQALEINPDNPRAYYLMGQNIYHTPSFFGGGAKKALPKFEKAAQLFENEAEKEKEALKPAWGQKMNQNMIDLCQENS